MRIWCEAIKTESGVQCMKILFKVVDIYGVVETWNCNITEYRLHIVSEEGPKKETVCDRRCIEREKGEGQMQNLAEHQ